VENANVTGTGSYFTGFNGPGMRISTIGAFPSGTIDSASPWARDFTLGMLVQAPLRADAAADSVMFLARGGTASGGNQAWQLWLTLGEDNKVRLDFSVQSWGGSYETITSDWIDLNA
jgi:hypothetical protein